MSALSLPVLCEIAVLKVYALVDEASHPEAVLVVMCGALVGPTTA